MADCEIEDCPGDRQLGYTCNECGGTFCTEHRLPESHNCPELRITGSDDEDRNFATGLQDKPDKKRGLTKRDRTRATESTTDKPEPMDLDSSQTVGTSNEPATSRSPDVQPDGSIAGPASSGNESSNVRTGIAARLSANVEALFFGALQSASTRLRTAGSTLWHVLTGIARLSGAALTLGAVGWIVIASAPTVHAGNLQQLDPPVEALIVLLLGSILVETTKQ